MDDIAEKKLSKLSRGIGTQSGKLIRETPIFSSDSASEDLQREKSNESLEDLFLLRIRGKNTGHPLQQHLPIKKHQKHLKTSYIHKTYSTRLGNLILYADSLYLGKKRKHKKSKKENKYEIEELKYEGTVEELADSILRFGNGNFIFVADKRGLRDEKIVSVRPGYSPMRYIASVSKLWNPERVEKLLEENALNEFQLQRYKKIKLPKIDIVPSSDHDPLLRDRPKPYTHTSLPELFRGRDPAPSRTDDDDEEAEKARPCIEDASSGYARSFISDGKVERRKLARKQTMQMNRLEINLPALKVIAENNSKQTETFEEEEDTENCEDESSESISDWGKLVETSKQVVDRTFERFFEKPEERRLSLKPNSDTKHQQSKIESNQSNAFDSLASVVAAEKQDSLTNGDYASLNQNQKEELISHLLLQDITKEVSTIESLMSSDQEDETRATPENKIDLSEQVSFPTSQRHGSFSDSGSLRGFKGNALHGRIPAAQSVKSKGSSKSGSLKDSMFISSFNKLPPIKSEPATPNVDGNRRKTGDMQKLPIMRKKVAALGSSKTGMENEELDDLFVGGRGIDVADIKLNARVDENLEDDDDDDLIKLLREKESDKEARMTDESIHENGSSESVETSVGYQTPDSGRSTGTGLTAASDINATQGEQRNQKEPMTPVVEESSRSSKSSKLLSRDNTLNRTKSSISEAQMSLVREKNNRKGSFLPNEIESNVGLDEDLTDLVVESEQDEKEVAIKSDEEQRLGSIEENHNEVASKTDIERGEEENASSIHDEGVFVEEEQSTIPNETEDANNDDLSREHTNTDVENVVDSADITMEEEQNSDDTKTISESFASRDSTGFLQVQARAAAHSALSRPRSGMDLFEDMKTAATELGKIFGENIQKEASKSLVLRRGRTQSDANYKTPVAKNTSKSRSMSVLSLKTRKRMGSVDVDMLKANVSGLGALVDKNIPEDESSPKPAIKSGKEKEDTASKTDSDRASVTSFPAGSSKSEISTEKGIQMDIISYAQVEKENSKTDSLIVKEGAAEQVYTKEKTMDTEEEEFQQALQAIVEEVKDLKEKKPQKTKKIRKFKGGPEEKNNIVRDRMSASPPFLAGRVKESKPPKGLSQIDETKKKSKGKGNKKGKETTKKIKVKKEGRKKVTFNEKVNVEDREVKDDSKIVEEENEAVVRTENERKSEETEDEKSNGYDKYDVPITIKQAKARDGSAMEEEEEAKPAKEENMEDVRNSPDTAKEVKDGGEIDANVALHASSSFVSSNGNETDGSAMVSGNEEGLVNEKHIDARMQKRKLEAEKRRLKVEQRRREREDAKRKMVEQAEREERLKQEAELEMQRRVEQLKEKKNREEEERTRQEEEEKSRQRRLERERERERKEKEELKKKMAAMQAKLKLEEEMRREQERIAREIEEELKRQEEEKLKEMEEHERLEYERKKREEEEERLRLEEERKRIEREKRLVEEEEHKIKMQKLEEFHRMLLERAKFWEGMKNSKWFLEWNQRLTEAFTFSYFDLLPAMLFEFTSLRPFTPKDNKKRANLPTIDEERKNDAI